MNVSSRSIWLAMSMRVMPAGSSAGPLKLQSEAV